MSIPVTVLDYGIGNLLNVCRALEAMGATVTLASRAHAGLEDASRMVLPGVGAFGDGMTEMKDRSWPGRCRQALCPDAAPVPGHLCGHADAV